MDAEQPGLWDEEQRQRIAEAAADDRTIQQAFERFHADHPRVYILICRFARDLKRRGYDHAGIGLIWERMRWEVALESDPMEPFKLSNNHRSRYARLIMRQEPDLDGFFRLRPLTAE